MSIDLDHAIIRARDKHRSARFLADILGLQVGTATPPFLPIRTGNGVTLDVPERELRRRSPASTAK
jgi:catechol 2,3-dioxygenase-like lactoylglutathione lyase family enzyme